MRSGVAFLAACCLLAAHPAAQSKLSLEQLLDRMGAYLIDYESQLSSVVADEKFEQNIYSRLTVSITLESEVSFIRLPGGAEWLGISGCEEVNGRPVASAAHRSANY